MRVYFRRKYMCVTPIEYRVRETNSIANFFSFFEIQRVWDSNAATQFHASKEQRSWITAIPVYVLYKTILHQSIDMENIRRRAPERFDRRPSIQ